MQEVLRNLRLDARNATGFRHVVPKTKPAVEKRQLTDAQRKELRAMLVLILREYRRRLPPDATKAARRIDGLAKAAGHSVSTWHAWGRKSPTSPKYFDLRDFAAQAGYSLGLIASGTGATVSPMPDTPPDDEEIAEVKRILADITDPGIRQKAAHAAALAASEAKAREYRKALAQNPKTPTAEPSGPSRDRRKTTSGTTSVT